MMARFAQNLGIKLLSLCCSFALFLYVHKQQAGELKVKVPLTVLLDPTTRVVNRTQLPRTISVTFSGPAERLQRLEREARAVVDLRSHGSGTYHAPVEVHLEPDSTADAHEAVEPVWQPQVLSVQLEEDSVQRAAASRLQLGARPADPELSGGLWLGKRRPSCQAAPGFHQLVGRWHPTGAGPGGTCPSG